MSNEPLLPRVATGDPDAPKACIERFGPFVWSLARRACDSTAEAEDAVQEIFIDLWKSAARFDPRSGSEATFVAIVARRRLIDRRRKRGRRLPEGEIPESVIDLVATRAAELSIEASIAAQAIEAMREDHRRILAMATYEGMSHGEIAQALSLPLGTVKATIRRGLRAIRRRLEGASDEDEADE